MTLFKRSNNETIEELFGVLTFFHVDLDCTRVSIIIFYPGFQEI